MTDGNGPDEFPADTKNRLVSPLADADDQVIESALRPKRLNEFIRQARIKKQLSLMLAKQVYQGYGYDLASKVAQGAVKSFASLVTGTIAVGLA